MICLLKFCQMTASCWPFTSHIKIKFPAFLCSKSSTAQYGKNQGYLKKNPNWIPMKFHCQHISRWNRRLYESNNNNNHNTKKKVQKTFSKTWSKCHTFINPICSLVDRKFFNMRKTGFERRKMNAAAATAYYSQSCRGNLHFLKTFNIS